MKAWRMLCVQWWKLYGFLCLYIIFSVCVCVCVYTCTPTSVYHYTASSPIGISEGINYTGTLYLIWYSLETQGISISKMVHVWFHSGVVNLIFVSLSVTCLTVFQPAPSDSMSLVSHRVIAVYINNHSWSMYVQFGVQ